METDAKKNHDSVVYKSHEADKAVVTEFARMGADKLRKEIQSRGLTPSRSKERMVALLASNQAFLRGRNVGRSEESVKPQDEEKACEEKRDTRPCDDDCRDRCEQGQRCECGRPMEYLGAAEMNGIRGKAYVCRNEDCDSKAIAEFQKRTPEDVLNEYKALIRRENELTGRSNLMINCTYPKELLSTEEVKALADKINECIGRAMYADRRSRSPFSIGGPDCLRGMCSCFDRDDKADVMRYGKPEPFSVQVHNENNGIPGLKCLLLGITFLIIGALPCDALRMEFCVGGSNLMGQLGIVFVGLSAWLHWRD